MSTTIGFALAYIKLIKRTCFPIFKRTHLNFFWTTFSHTVYQSPMIERQKFYVRAISAAMVHFILEVDVHLVFQTSLNWKANIRQKPSVLLHSVLSKYLGAEMFEQPFSKNGILFLGKVNTHTRSDSGGRRMK